MKFQGGCFTYDFFCLDYDNGDNLPTWYDCIELGYDKNTNKNFDLEANGRQDKNRISDINMIIDASEEDNLSILLINILPTSVEVGK